MNDLVPREIYVASAYVWLPDEFSVTAVGMIMHGTATLYGEPADPSRRGVWQLVWVSARMAENSTSLTPRLQMVGPTGATVFSAGWRFELGAVPRNLPRIG